MRGNLDSICQIYLRVQDSRMPTAIYSCRTTNAVYQFFIAKRTKTQHFAELRKAISFHGENIIAEMMPGSEAKVTGIPKRVASAYTCTLCTISPARLIRQVLPNVEMVHHFSVH
ncbi:MAG: hypothetical protein R2788_03035 [Saprospiraceae bacterium]